MRVGILDTEKNIIDAFVACQTSTRLLETKEVVKEGDLKEIDALLIYKSQAFSIREVCEWLIKVKIQKPIPIWIATSEKQIEGKSVYFQLGLCGIFEEDYTVEEISLSISNSLNTMKSSPQVKVQENQYFQLDPLKLSLSVGETTVSLTRQEYCLLEVMYSNKEEVCTYEMLSESILGEELEIAGEIGQSRVANIVCKVRAKITQASDGKQELIRTIRSRGYMLTLST